MSPPSPAIAVVARRAPLLTVDGLTFKDLNKNGRLDPYEDWRLPVAQRVADLVARLTVEEKVGLMHYASNQGAFTGPQGELLDAPNRPLPTAADFEPRFDGHLPPAPYLSPRETVLGRHLRYINNFGGGPPVVEARWNNALQELAEGSRLGIPIVFGTDPRNANPRSGFAQWPPQLGQAATRDAGLVRALAAHPRHLWRGPRPVRGAHRRLHRRPAGGPRHRPTERHLLGQALSRRWAGGRRL